MYIFEYNNNLMCRVCFNNITHVIETYTDISCSHLLQSYSRNMLNK